MIDLAKWIRKFAGSQLMLEFIRQPEDDPQVRRPDITLAGQTLGWEPKTPVEKGLRATIDWWRKSRLGEFECSEPDRC